MPGTEEASQGVKRRVAFVVPGEHAEADEEWLAPYERLSSAENIARLTGDQAILDELHKSGFEGAHYTYFASELAKYGMAVMIGWIRKGVIFDRVATRGFGRPKSPPDGALDGDEAESLAGEVVATSLSSFRTTVLLPGRWDPAKGASLKTYFIGHCLMRFSNVYQAWLGGLVREEAISVEDEVLANNQPPATADVARAAVLHDEVQRLLQRIADPQVREALILHAAGHSYLEIGKRLGKTPKAIERMVANTRDRLAKGSVA